MGAAEVLARRTFLDARTRTIAFASAVYSYIQPAGFRGTYPTVADRIAFAHSFAGNDAIRFFYGYPFDPVTIGGYSAWRVGGTLAIAAAVFGVLAAVTALRTEEDTGRMKLVLAAPVLRRTVFASAMLGIATGVAILWPAMFAGYVVAGLPVGGSAYLALRDGIRGAGVRRDRRDRLPARADAPRAVAYHVARRALVNGAPGVVAFADGVPRAVLGFTVAGGKIIEMNVLADPVRLRQLDLTVLVR